MLRYSFLYRLILLLCVPVSITAQNGPSATDLPAATSIVPVVTQDTALHLRDNSQPWTLQECVTYAQQHNISVQQQQLNVKMAQANVLASQGSFLPNLNAGVSHTY
ncbi:MAG: TolC family protein, partial [Bacteroidia bacterium]